MRTSQATSSVLLMAVSVTLISVAVIATHALFRPAVRLNASLLAESPLFWVLLAVSCALAGILLLTALWRINRAPFFRVGNALIHSQILIKELARIWAIRFPELAPPHDVWLLRSRNWQIELTLPPDSPLLPEIDREVSLLLRDRFGFSGPFTLCVQETPSKPRRPAL